MLYGAVSGIEDHGCVIDIGLDGITAFMPLKGTPGLFSKHIIILQTRTVRKTHVRNQIYIIVYTDYRTLTKMFG